MARPVKQRRVCELPGIMEFAPCSKENYNIVEMTVDEYEVIRLIDHLHLTQSECAQQMDVARTTIQAIYDNARSKIADTIVNGKKLVIQGGTYTLCSRSGFCCGKDCSLRRGLLGHCRDQSRADICCGKNRFCSKLL